MNYSKPTVQQLSPALAAVQSHAKISPTAVESDLSRQTVLPAYEADE